jgi:dipeptidyl-peptidase 4
MKLVLAAVVASMSLSLAHAAVLTPERVFASPDLSGPQARGVALAPDGSAVTYLKAKTDDVDVTDLWIADVNGGAARMLIDGRALSPAGRELSEAEKSRRERMGLKTHGTSRASTSWRRCRATCGSTSGPAARPGS